MSSDSFDDHFKRIVTEKTHVLEGGNCYAFIAKKDTRKALAGFLFKKKFSVYPKKISSLTCRKTSRVRVGRRFEHKASKIKKFYFHLEKGVSINIES